MVFMCLLRVKKRRFSLVKLPDFQKIGYVETLSFQQMVKHLFTEGTVPVPRTAPSLCDCVVLPSLELSFKGGVTAAKAEELHAVAQKRSLRKIF
jgi:hypothetical protein